MVAKNTTAPEFDPTAQPGTAPDDWEFETVAEAAPTRVLFDQIGDVFIGKYMGREFVKIDEPSSDGKDQSFYLHLFKGYDGDTYSVNNSYDLDEKMEDVEQGTWVRLTYKRDVKTSRGLNAMKSFQVDKRK